MADAKKGVLKDKDGGAILPLTDISQVMCPDGSRLNTKIEDIGRYTTDEQVIGTWVNGKTLYRKVVNVRTPSAVGNAYAVFNYSALNVEKLVKIGGQIYPTDGSVMPINFFGSGSFYIATYSSARSIYINVGAANYANADAVLILEYTKNE